MVVIGLWLPIIGWAADILPQQSENAAPTAAERSADINPTPTEDDAAAQDAEDAQPDAETTEPAEAIADEAEAVAEQERLAWRDEDFAVDPNKNTDWNYEPNGRKVVYLTIDDGPSENTQAVLDILDKYDCKATFFVTGICPDYAYQIREEYQRGHTVGMHTYSHDYAQVYASQAAFYADLDAIGQVVSEQIGFVPCFIRFPGGSSNAISANYTRGIMSALVNGVQAEGYQYYDWNASTGDGDVHTADELFANACEFDELENVVMLCHDSSTKQETVKALPRIIEHYQKLGYTFEAIDRTTMVPHHGVNN
ncbi:MAG: polysaccharide deacetylase family protein [Coriobacteriia bacterium]|nr:polysaccharide deacetylase family protein [Coriobacteriia bacterium]